MQYGNSLDSGESNCLITRLLGQSQSFHQSCPNIVINHISIRALVSASSVYFYSDKSNCAMLDIMLYLCERGHVEGGMVFQLLEDLTDMSTIKDCKDVFGYIESKQDVLGKVIVNLSIVLIFNVLWCWYGRHNICSLFC